MSARIATTQWSQVFTARDGSATEARRALATLCQTYWQPLYAFFRHLGSDPEEARDLTQAYFAELLEKDFLAEVDADKGRFRSFLFSTARHFLSHHRERTKAAKRGGGLPTLSLDVAAGERNYVLQAAPSKTPEELFEYRWAMTVITRALERLQEESARAGSERQFEQLRTYLTGNEPHVRYRELAETLGMKEGAIKVAVHRLRKRFGQCLRAELVETVADPGDVDDELRHLLRVLRG